MNVAGVLDVLRFSDIHVGRPPSILTRYVFRGDIVLQSLFYRLYRWLRLDGFSFALAILEKSSLFLYLRSDG